MSAQKEEAKQRKRKSLKMALEKCMQRREAATTTNTNNTNTTTTTNTAMDTSLAATTYTSLGSNVTTTSTSTTTAASLDILSPDGSLNLQVPKGPEITSTPQKLSKHERSQEMEVLETTETETSMDTSAEINAGESREEEELESSETSVNSSTNKVAAEQQQQQQELKHMEMYDDKPLDFTKSPNKKPKDDDNEAKDVEEYLKSTAVIKETSKLEEAAPTKDNAKEESKDSEASLKDN